MSVYREGDATRVITLVQNEDGTFSPPPIGAGFGSDVNVTNAVLGVRDGSAAGSELAKDSTLVAVRDHVDTLETIETAVRTALEDRLPKNAKQFASGAYRTAGGKVTLTISQVGSINLSNPAGSGRVITVTEFSLASTVAVDVTYFKDATSTSPLADVFMPHRGYEGVATTVGQVRLGASAGTGGTAISPVTRLGANAPERIPYTAVLMPGMSLSVRATATTGLDFYGSVTWIEE